MVLINSFILFGQDSDSELKKMLDNANNVGYDYLVKGRYDSAEYYLLKTVELKEGFYGPNSRYTAMTHINLAALYRSKLDYKNALLHLDLAESIFREVDPNSRYLSYVYHNKGNIYLSYNDLAECARYYEYALDLLKRLNLIRSKEFEFISISYYNSLIARNLDEQADSMINEIMSMTVDPSIKFQKHLFLAIGYENRGLINEAFKELDLASAAFKQQEYSKDDLLRLNYRYASLYLKRGEILKARISLNKNLSLEQENIQLNYKRLIKYYYRLADTYIVENQYAESFLIVDNAINKINESIEYSEMKTTAKYKGIIENELNILYLLKAKSSVGIFRSTNDIKHLKEAIEDYSKTIEKLTQSRLNMKNEESIILSTEKTIDVFHEAINVAFELYKLTGDQEYLEQSFKYTENSKSFALISEIKGVEAIEFSDIPMEIKEEEERYTREIAAYEELLYNEQVADTPDSARLSNFNDELFHLKNNYNSLLDEIENNYPNYFELKYNPHFASLDEISKKLHRNEALIEYVLSDTILTTFIIDQDQTKVLQQPIDSAFSIECYNYYTMLQSQEFDQNVHDTYREYVRLGRLFYETLVAPVIEVTDKKEITFVPDGELMYLPFESFITTEVDDEHIDYMNLPYLIHEMSVAYSYSSTLLFSDRLQTKSPENKVLAFAPMYDNLMDEFDPLQWNRQGNPDFLIPLLGAKEEVRNIANRVPSEVFMDMNASERNFKKFASDYSILHLAMHTIMNDRDPMFSRLAFTRTENDTVEDNDLFTYEIYNMKLNADMIVLSSCSSGYGKMQKGEGMMSLSRGFMYAGCPSIVMTLWQVSDKSSAELMSSFYKYLKRGKSKKEALRHAKIDYIKNSDGLKSNPYFWSGFVQVGDSTPLYRKNASFYWIIIIVGFVGLVFFFQYRGKLKKMIKK